MLCLLRQTATITSQCRETVLGKGDLTCDTWGDDLEGVLVTRKLIRFQCVQHDRTSCEGMNGGTLGQVRPSLAARTPQTQIATRRSCSAWILQPAMPPRGNYSCQRLSSSEAGALDEPSLPGLLGWWQVGNACRPGVAAGRRIFSAARVSDFDAEGQPTLKRPNCPPPRSVLLAFSFQTSLQSCLSSLFPTRLRKYPRCGSCWAVRSWPLSPCKSLSPGSARGRTWVRTATGRWQPGRTIPRTKRKRTENEKRSSSPDASNRAESEYCATSRSPATAFGSLAMPGLPSSGGDDRHLHHARQACGTRTGDRPGWQRPPGLTSKCRERRGEPAKSPANRPA